MNKGNAIHNWTTVSSLVAAPCSILGEFLRLTFVARGATADTTSYSPSQPDSSPEACYHVARNTVITALLSLPPLVFNFYVRDLIAWMDKWLVRVHSRLCFSHVNIIPLIKFSHRLQSCVNYVKFVANKSFNIKTVASRPRMRMGDDDLKLSQCRHWLAAVMYKIGVDAGLIVGWKGDANDTRGEHARTLQDMLTQTNCGLWFGGECVQSTVHSYYHFFKDYLLKTFQNDKDCRPIDGDVSLPRQIPFSILHRRMLKTAGGGGGIEHRLASPRPYFYDNRTSEPASPSLPLTPSPHTLPPLSPISLTQQRYARLVERQTEAAAAPLPPAFPPLPVRTTPPPSPPSLPPLPPSVVRLHPHATVIDTTPVVLRRVSAHTAHKKNQAQRFAAVALAQEDAETPAELWRLSFPPRFVEKEAASTFIATPPLLPLTFNMYQQYYEKVAMGASTLSAKHLERPTTSPVIIPPNFTSSKGKSKKDNAIATLPYSPPDWCSSYLRMQSVTPEPASVQSH